MTFIGNHDPAKVSICIYCGTAVFEVVKYAACDSCDTRNLFSDAWKDEYGTRPHVNYTLREMKEWLAALKNGSQDFTSIS